MSVRHPTARSAQRADPDGKHRVERCESLAEGGRAVNVDLPILDGGGDEVRNLVWMA